VELIHYRTGVSLDERVLTIGFARRATSYKRADLLFSDLERLRSITRDIGPLQVIYSGKAHPQDTAGKALIRRIFAASAEMGEAMRVVYLENYDMALARDICAGVDLWLNTPQRPQEASGTSGMKAALNGVPSLSVLDGWWLEGHQEGVTGWAIGDGQESGEETPQEVASLYDKLEHSILPLFYQQSTEFAKVMRSAIALNGSFFNTQRMMFQYLRNAYFGVES
jgi:starch phosphorylase